MQTLHNINILLHIIVGSIALLLGFIALLTIKGSKIHNKSGKYFLGFMSIVILTGLVGVFVYGRNTVLLIITVLTGYVSFSGYRILLLKSNAPKIIDISVALISLLVLIYFLYYFQSIGMFWSPIVTYSGVGALFFIVSYDFLRYLIPREKYKKHRIWIYEHIYKMTSAVFGLLAAFVGNVFDEYQPHSQYMPSALGMLIIFGFMIYVYRFGLKKLPKPKNS